jgi:hypothetical protein
MIILLYGVQNHPFLLNIGFKLFVINLYLLVAIADMKFPFIRLTY